MGPYNAALKKYHEDGQANIKYKITWNTLGEYLQFLENKGISVNLASFLGAATVRSNVLGFENRRANSSEMEKMKGLVEQAM